MRTPNQNETPSAAADKIAHTPGFRIKDRGDYFRVKWLIPKEEEVK